MRTHSAKKAVAAVSFFVKEGWNFFAKDHILSNIHASQPLLTLHLFGELLLLVIDKLVLPFFLGHV